MEEELYLIHIYWECNQCNSNCQGPSISILIHCCVPVWEVVTVLPKSIHPKLCFQLQLNEYLMPFYEGLFPNLCNPDVSYCLSPAAPEFWFPCLHCNCQEIILSTAWHLTSEQRLPLEGGTQLSARTDPSLLCREGRTRQLLPSSCCHLPQSVCCSPSLSVGWKEMLHSWSGCQKGRVKEAAWNLIFFMVIALFCYQDMHSPVVYEDWQILNSCNITGMKRLGISLSNFILF